MLTPFGLDKVVGFADCCPWGATTGRHVARAAAKPLYTAAERARRDGTRWTVVQGVLAPLQFAVFLVSLGLVLRALFTSDGFAVANASVIVKTGVLYLIMVTGAVWERKVFGRYLFAPAFWWEDAFSMVVIALHTGYVAALVTGALAPHALMLLALSAYAAYLINATQFVMKLRAARRDEARWPNRAAFMNGALGLPQGHAQ